MKREQSAIEQRVLHFQYFSASRGVLEFRNVLVHRVFAVTPIRFELQVYVRRLAEGDLRVTELPRAKALRVT